MKNKIRLCMLMTLLFSFACVQADEYYEGVGLFANNGPIDWAWLPQFLPYNPVIVEAGAFRGSETLRAAKVWPQGRIIAIEPNPDAFELLQKATQGIENIETHCLALSYYNGTALLNVCHGMQGTEPAFGYASSLLPPTKEMQVYCQGPQVKVPCATLDTWCAQHQIDQIDILRLELEGMELPVLLSSPRILKNIKIVYVKTGIHPYRTGMTQYDFLKSFLETAHFVLLSHRFTPGITGHAIFLSRELFDAYFKLSLGIYTEV